MLRNKNPRLDRPAVGFEGGRDFQDEHQAAAEHAKAMEKALKPKTLDEMLEEYDLEMAED